MKSRSNNPLTAFGELLVSDRKPVFEVSFSHVNNPRLISTTTVGGGAVANAQSMATCTTEASEVDDSAIIQSKKRVDYRPGSGALFRFTGVFTDGYQAGCEQYIGCFDAENGFAFGYQNGDGEFGILHRSDAVTPGTPVDVFIPQSTWNIDTLQSTDPDTAFTLDPTQGNVFQISFQYLGFGRVLFFIEAPGKGLFIPVHSLDYANSNSVPSIGNPHLPVRMEVTNAEASPPSQDVEISSASWSGFVEGSSGDDTTPYFAYDRTFAYTTSGFKNVFTLFNDDTANFGTRTNTIPMKLDSLSVGTDGTKNFIVELIIDSPDAEVTVGGTPSFADIETASSVAEVDIAGTTVSGGTKIAAFALGKVAELVWEPAREILIEPGEKLYIATSSAANGDITVALDWSERQ